MKLILLGAPGSGKGTQASAISRKLNIAKLSTGDMLRETAASGSDLGNELQKIMSSGALVDDETMVSIIKDRIKNPDCENGFILDGYPRTIAQAEALDEMLNSQNDNLDAVIELKVNDDILVSRISGRFSCANCGEGYHDSFKPTKESGKCDICGSNEFSRRADDNEETVKSRLIAYHSQTAPLLPYYEKAGILQTIDGMAEMAEVERQIVRIIESEKVA